MAELNINTLYENVLNELKLGKRPLLNLSNEELIHLAATWEDLIEREETEKLFPILCILDHSKSSHTNLHAPLIKTLQESNHNDILVFTLSASLKIIIEECERQGKRIPFQFIKSLETPLNSTHPEVLEWSLRVVEALGNQSIILKELILQKKPGILSVFNQHKKNSRQIIEYLEKRWQGRAN